MNRRDFFKRASLVAAGAVVADKLELLDMLAPRRLFSSIDLGPGLTHATYTFSQTNHRYVVGRESLLITGHENLIPLVAWSNDYNEWNAGLGASLLSSSVHELKTSVYPEWQAGPDWGRARAFRYPKEFARGEPRFMRELRALIDRELPDPAIDPRSRPRFMREFDKLWQNGA
jgi:hypothetical protein